jgi:hypothetical protein
MKSKYLATAWQIIKVSTKAGMNGMDVSITLIAEVRIIRLAGYTVPVTSSPNKKRPWKKV